MSPEIQLVLIGGLIAILSSISTAVLTSWLAYRIENRRERRRLRVELSKTYGQLAKQKGNAPREWEKVHQSYVDFLGRPFKDEDLAFLIGLLGEVDQKEKG